MNIFSNFAQTAYTYHKRRASDTWTGSDTAEDYQGWGVFKIRNLSDLPQLNVTETAQPTLNIKPSEPFINRKNTGAMVGDSVTIPSYNGTTYKVVGVTTAMNYRTKRVEHYRLILQEVAK